MAGLILPLGFQNGTKRPRPRVQFDNLEELRAATKLPGFHEKGSFQNHVCGLLHIPSFLLFLIFVHFMHVLKLF